MIKWIAVKIKNQLNKLIRIFYSVKLVRFNKTFKQCGQNVFIKFPVCIEGAGFISLGDNVSINAFVHMWGHGGINIGNDCLIASHVSINSLTHDPDAPLIRSVNIANEVNIGNNVWIGSHAVILPGVTIGDNSVIGAGSMVNRDIPANTVAAGVPARIIRSKN